MPEEPVTSDAPSPFRDPNDSSLEGFYLTDTETLDAINRQYPVEEVFRGQLAAAQAITGLQAMQVFGGSRTHDSMADREIGVYVAEATNHGQWMGKRVDMQPEDVEAYLARNPIGNPRSDTGSRGLGSLVSAEFATLETVDGRVYAVPTMDMVGLVAERVGYTPSAAKPPE